MIFRASYFLLISNEMVRTVRPGRFVCIYKDKRIERARTLLPKGSSIASIGAPLFDYVLNLLLSFLFGLCSDPEPIEVIARAISAIDLVSRTKLEFSSP